MDVREFVSATLTQIAFGVSDAQIAMRESPARVNPRLLGGNIQGHGPLADDGSLTRVVEFDIAIEVKAETGTNAKVSVVGGIFGLSAGGQSADASARTSRIKFSVPMSFPISEGLSARST